MPEVNNVKLSFSKKNSTSDWETTVTGDVTFNSNETGRYRLEIKLFAEDGFQDDANDDRLLPIFSLQQPPIYVFKFIIGTLPLIAGASDYKNVSVNGETTLKLNETRVIKPEILNEDPGSDVLIIPDPNGEEVHRSFNPKRDEIYATVIISQVQASGRSAVETIEI